MAVEVCPPYTLQSALANVKAEEKGWSSCDSVRCHTVVGEFFNGTDAIVEFLTPRWEQELEHRLMKELWCYMNHWISMRFEYELHDMAGEWYRTHGGEHWEFNGEGLMNRKDKSANDVPIQEHERRYIPPPKL